MRNYTLGLKAKLILPIIFAICISLFVSIAMVTLKAENLLLQNSDERIRNASVIIGNTILQKIDRAKSDVTFASKIPQFASALNPYAVYNYASREEFIASSNALLAALGEACGYYETFYVTDATGMTKICSLESAVGTLDISNRDWFHQAMKTDEIVVSEPFRSRITGDALVAIAKRFEHEGQKGLMIGSLQIRKITQAALEEESRTWMKNVIITSSGMTLASLNDEDITTLSYANEPWFEKILVGTAGHFEIENVETPTIVSFYHLPGTNLITLAFVDKNYILAPIKNIITYGKIATVITIILASALMYTIVNAITKDIFKIADHANKIGMGELNNKLHIKRNDELGSLAKAIDSMVESLKIMIKKAEEATKAKSDFLARMSHEIRTPMNAIIGMAHIGLQNNPEEKQKKCLEKIQQAAEGLLGIINDILDFSKVEAGRLELEVTVFRLSGLIRSMTDLLEVKAKEKGLSFNFHVQDNVPDFLVGDSLRISQVCINLCTNALKFTEKGSVRVDISVQEQQGKHVTLLFKVKDTGIGLKPELTEGLFEAFSQEDGSTTRRFGGTGLGLTICKHLVHMMGGTIWVESEFGKGSTFFFTINVQEALDKEQKEQDKNDDIDISKVNFKSMLVLLVDDNELNQEIGLELLRQIGIHPILAGNGAEALERCKEQAFDLVLMDIHMPIMDGLEATRRIRQLEGPCEPDMPIIAMTANAMSGDREKSLAAGMNDHLTKPINFKELYQTIYRWQKH